MSSRSRTTELRVLAGAVGVGALVAAVAGIRHRRSTRGLTLSSDVEPNALLKTPTLKADISELTTDDGAIINVRAPARGGIRNLSPLSIVALVAVTALVGWFVPLLGISLLAFLLIDVCIAAFKRRATT